VSAEEPKWHPSILGATRLDRSVLEELVEGDLDFLREVIVAFCAELVVCLESTLDNLSDTRKIAHTLKASAYYIGALRLSAMATEIELSVLTGGEARFSERWHSLQGEASSVICELRSLLDERLAGHHTARSE
jgi:hypothetical protein